MYILQQMKNMLSVLSLRTKLRVVLKSGIIRDNARSNTLYLENIGPAIEHIDWLILVIGPLTARVV